MQLPTIAPGKRYTLPRPVGSADALLLARALEQAGAAVTDESSAVEALGLAPRLVPGEFENFKLTWPADFALAARLLETR